MNLKRTMYSPVKYMHVDVDVESKNFKTFWSKKQIQGECRSYDARMTHLSMVISLRPTNRVSSQRTRRRLQTRRERYKGPEGNGDSGIPDKRNLGEVWTTLILTPTISALPLCLERKARPRSYLGIRPVLPKGMDIGNGLRAALLALSSEIATSNLKAQGSKT